MHPLCIKDSARVRSHDEGILPFFGTLFPFFPVLFSSHHYPSMVGALLCITVSCPVVFITVTPPLVKIADSTWVGGLCVDLVVELRNRFI